MNRIERCSFRSAEGGTLLVALLMLLVLSLVGANVLRSVTTRYDYTQKSIGWEKALDAAEAGAEFGLANCRWSVTGASTPWVGWKKYDPVSKSWIAVTGPADANAELLARRKIVYDLPAGSHLAATGEGSIDLWYHAEVDAPASMVVNGNSWYRIRSTGYAGLPGLARAGSDSGDRSKSHNDLLRKLDLKSDHFIKRYGDYANAIGTTVAVRPQATRRVELVAKPKTPFGFVMVATAPTGGPLGIPQVDSYDSRDAVNYPGGLYSSSPRNPATGVGCNADVYINAPISTLDTMVYGDVTTANGTLTKTSSITGTVNNNGTGSAPLVTVPTWGTVASAPSTTLVAGTTAAPLYRSWSSINKLTVTLPAGSTSGEVNLYVTGNVTGGITVAKGVTLKIWMEGNFSMKNSDINNLNENAAYLQIYGINPPAGQTRKISIGSGTALSYAVFDAPGHDFNANGNADVAGAIIAKSIDGNGNTTWHYDEALANVGSPIDYKRAMWVEDER